MLKFALDTETTGLEPGSRIVEIAVVAFDDVTGEQSGDYFHSLINPGMPMPPDATAMNNITDEMLANAPPAGLVLDNLIAWLPDDPTFVIHNAPFDCGALDWVGAAVRVNIEKLRTASVIDTLRMARTIDQTKDDKLQTLVDFYGIPRIGAEHSALSDADACRQYSLIASLLTPPEAMPWASTYGYTEHFPENLRHLPFLVASGGDLRFVYSDAKGKTTDRTITPYGWAAATEGIIFHGLCHLRGERRTFRADRVVDVCPLVAGEAA